MALDQSLGTGLYDPTRAATDAVVTPKAAAAPSIDPANLTANDLLEASRREQSQKAEKEIGLAQNTAEAAERKAALSKEFADKAMNMPEHQQIKDLEASRQKAFIPTQETANDLGALFMLTNILGFAIGGKTKGNAQAALSAMNGMLEGHNKGREDVYKREKDIFEENQKTIDRTLSELHNSMKEGMQLLATDREAGNQVIDAALSKNNARFLQDFKAKNGNAPTMEVLEKLMEIQRKKDETIQNQKNKDREYNLQLAKFKQEKDRATETANKGEIYVGKDGALYRVTPDNKVTKIEGSEGFNKPGSAGKGSATKGTALQQERAYNVVQNFELATNDLINVSKQPAGTVLGTFAGMTGQSGDGLISSLANTFARKVTEPDQRAMQQLISGLDANLARVMGSGYASSSAGKLVKAYQEQTAREGDSPAIQALFLARVKQELGSIAKTFKNHPGSNEGYVSQMKSDIDSLDEHIPFDVDDVLDAMRKGRIDVSQDLVNFVKSRPNNSIQQEEYVVGHVYTDAKGIKAKYLGNGKWEE